MSTPNAGWYRDPDGSGKLRYWDGEHWTGHFYDNKASAAETTSVAAGSTSSTPNPVSVDSVEADRRTVDPKPFETATPRPGAKSSRSFSRQLQEKPWMQVALGMVSLVLIIAIGGAIGSGEESSSNDAPVGRDSVSVDVSAPDDGQRVRSSSVLVRGTATPGASIEVEGAGDTKADANGNWSIRVTATSGDNYFPIQAKKQGMKDSGTSVSFTRKLTAAEKKRQAAKLRARRAAAKERFINSAKAIPYGKLNKDADRYAGDRIALRGQVFQIQEDGDLGGIMLLSVTDEGYGIWSDNVWINYDRSISATEEDIVTVYGTVVGTTEYETQIGGSTYVPEVDARYVVVE